MTKTLMNLNPWNDIREVAELFDRLFETAPARSLPASDTLQLPVDVYEREGKVFVRAAVPGVAPQDLDVTIEDGVLTIRGETKTETSTEDTKVYRREYRYGAFSRSIRLPENVDAASVDAQFSNGLVTISIPRVEPEKPQALKVPVREAASVLKQE